MKKVLCVAEKNSIGAALARALGGSGNGTRSGPVVNHRLEYRQFPWGASQVVITAVAGHLYEQDFDPKFKNWQSCDPKVLFEAPVMTSISNSMKDLASNIEREARSADLLYIWTDCDREGEYIGHEIVQAAIKGNPSFRNPALVHRAEFNNTDPNHLRQAAASSRPLDTKMVESVRSRIELDLKTGAAFTRFITLLVQKATSVKSIVSYGSCQFPTLGFVVDRYRRVKEFVPEPIWRIDLSIKALPSNGNASASSGRGRNKHNTITLHWTRNHLFDHMSALAIYEKCLNSADKSHVRVSKVESKLTRKFKPLPLTTLELQKIASRYYRISSSEALAAAEALYQKGIVSYPRTETDSFPEDMNLQQLVSKQKEHEAWGTYAKKLIDDDQFVKPRSGKHNDKAHPPIHPIRTSQGNELTSTTQKKVLELITRHFLACCSPDAEGLSTTVECLWDQEVFRANGLSISKHGFLDVYPYLTWAENELPPVVQGSTLAVAKSALEESKTTAPSHLTETELLSLMDKNGIGTDATMASHVEKIIQREYVSRESLSTGSKAQKVLIPTKLGYGLVEAYEQVLDLDMGLTKPFLRREMEQQMLEIVQGQKDASEVIAHNIARFRAAYEQSEAKRAVIREHVKRYVQ